VERKEVDALIEIKEEHSLVNVTDEHAIATLNTQNALINVKAPQSFSTSNGNESYSSLPTLEDWIKAFESIKDEYFSDQKYSKKEILEQVLRTTYLQKYTLSNTLYSIDSFTNLYAKDEVFKHMRTLEEKHLRQLAESLPNEKVRPSLLLPLSLVFSSVAGIASSVVGKDLTNLAIYEFEKQIQDQIDEQLRILNENKIKHDDIRMLIVKMRDEAYASLKEKQQFAQFKQRQYTPAEQLVAQAIRTGVSIASSFSKIF